MRKRTTAVALAFALVAVAMPSARVQSGAHPDTIVVENTVLSRTGEAVREHLLGAVELYSVAVYAPGGGTVAPARLASRDTPKALRIVIRYQDDLRRDIPFDWKRELVPALNSRAMSTLRTAFASLQYGDVILIQYAPRIGTSVRVNERVAVTEANHDLMLAFLDHWLGQRPVSEAMKNALTP